MTASEQVLIRLRLAGQQAFGRGMRDSAGSVDKLADASLRARAAALRQERATDEVEKATRRWGRESRQAREAQLKLDRATRDVNQSLGAQETRASSAELDLQALGKKAGAAALAYVGLDSAIGLVNEALDRQLSEDVTAATLGLGPEAARKAGEVAADAYVSGVGESRDAVFDTVMSIGMNIGDVEAMREDDLLRLVRRTMNLELISRADANEITRVAGEYLRTGMVRHTEDVFDVLAYGVREGANRSGELLDTFREYREPVQSLGLDMEDFLAIMIGGTEAGVYSVDRLGDALKEFSIKATDGSETTRRAFRRMGLDPRATRLGLSAGGEEARETFLRVVRAMDRLTEAQRNVIGFDLFGTMLEDVGWRDLSAAFHTVERRLRGVDGAARRVNDTLGHGSRQNITRLTRAAEELALDGLDWVAGAFLDVFDAARTAGDWIGNKWPLLTAGVSLPFTALTFAVTQIEAVGDAFEAVFGAVGGVAEGAFDAVRGIVIAGLDWIADQIDNVTGAVGSLGFDTPLGRVGAPQIGKVARPWSSSGDATASPGPAPRRRRGANPLGAVQGIPIAPIASGSRAGRRDLHVGVNIDGRQVGRAVGRNIDDDDQWGRD